MIIINALILVYRESKLKEKDKSTEELVKKAINTIGFSKDQIQLDSSIVLTNLKDIIFSLFKEKKEINKHSLLQNLRTATFRDTEGKIYETLKESIDLELNEDENLNLIKDLRYKLKDTVYEHSILTVINKASNDLKFNRDSIGDVKSYIDLYVETLETLVSSTKENNNQYSDTDLNNATHISDAFNKVKEETVGKGIYKTGWKAVNRMFQGGFREAKTYYYLGRQHNYKTSLGLSLDAQMARLNVPVLRNENKKPLILRYVLEDKRHDNILFLYIYLYSLKHGVKPNVKDLSIEEMTEFITSEMNVTGFHYKLRSRDPSSMTYKTIFDDISELEKEGYEVKILHIDYFSLIPRTGCTNDGTVGSDLRDLLRRLKNYCARPDKLITLLSPHQYSPAAKQKLRDGVPNHLFIKEICGLGMTNGSSQIDQEADGVLLTHLFTEGGAAYLSLLVEKHRLPTIISEKDKYALYLMPDGMPLLEDAHLERDTSYSELPKRTVVHMSEEMMI